MRKYLAGLVAGLSLMCSGTVLAGPVDINQANAAELAAALDGVGEVKAEAIVGYREEHGPFASAEDLTEVKGIGPKTVEGNRENITVGDE